MTDVAFQNTPEHCPCRISEIFDAWENSKRQRVEEAQVYQVPVSEIYEGGYLKMERNRDNALAPGKIKNETLEDAQKGQDNYDKLKASIHENGFDPLRPLSFLIRRRNENRKLHQGHHRLTIARELGIVYVPVVFVFDRQSRASRKASQ